MIEGHFWWCAKLHALFFPGHIPFLELHLVPKLSIGQLKHQTLAQTQMVITHKFSVPDDAKPHLRNLLRLAKAV